MYIIIYELEIINKFTKFNNVKCLTTNGQVHLLPVVNKSEGCFLGNIILHCVK